MFPKKIKETYVENIDCLVRDFSRVYRQELYNDISFVLMDGVTIETNRFMLASRSEYFATMLFGGLKEGASSKVSLQCTSSTFRHILDYVWEARVDFSPLNLMSLCDLMENARLMCLDQLVGGIEDYLKYLIKQEDYSELSY